MNQTALQAIAVSLVQKALIAGFTGLATYLGVNLGDYTAMAASLALVLVTAAWGLWNKLQAHRVAVAANAAGIDVKTVSKGTEAQAAAAGAAVKA